LNKTATSSTGAHFDCAGRCGAIGRSLFGNRAGRFVAWKKSLTTVDESPMSNREIRRVLTSAGASWVFRLHLWQKNSAEQNFFRPIQQPKSSRSVCRSRQTQHANALPCNNLFAAFSTDGDLRIRASRHGAITAPREQRDPSFKRGGNRRQGYYIARNMFASALQMKLFRRCLAAVRGPPKALAKDI